MTCMPTPSPQQVRILRWVALVVGCFAKFTSGSLFVFTVYQNALKQTFNYTQTEMETISSLFNFGLGIALPAGMVFDYFGPSWTALVGLITTSAGYLLIWSTTRMIDYYKTKAGLMAFYFLFVGHGSLYMYMAALNTNIINFSPKHRGKLIGFLNGFFSGSPTIFALLYGQLFAHGHYHDDEEKQDLSGFMLFFAVMFFVVNIFSVAFLRLYPATDEHSNLAPSDYEINNTAFNGGTDTPEMVKSGFVNNGFDGKSDENTPGNSEKVMITKYTDITEDEKGPDGIAPLSNLRQIMSLDYNIFLWLFNFSAMGGLLFINNVTTTTKSMGYEEANKWITMILPITNFIASLSLGLASDYFKSRIPRIQFLLFANFVFCASYLIPIFAPGNQALFATACGINGIGAGCLWSLAPTILSEMFSITQFGRNWGLVLFTAALVGMSGQTAFGKLYDGEIPPEGGITCLGINCVRWGYVVALGSTGVSILLTILLIWRRRRRS